MKNIMNFANGYQAVITYDPEIDMFRGEFINLNGGADFYSKDIDGLHHEGAESLRIFQEECKKHGINPHKKSTVAKLVHQTLENPVGLDFFQV